MSNRSHIAFLLPLVCLAGCAVSTPPTTQTTSSPSITGNWQIQSGTAITSPPTAPYLVGALQGSDSALTGTFTTPQSSGATVETYSGTYNSSTGALSLDLASQDIQVDLAVPADPNTVASGSYTSGCVPSGSSSVTCTSGTEVPVVGVEVAPLNGTYTGTLSGYYNNGSQTTQISGTGSLTLTQSATPNSSGQFPLTGAVTYPSSSGLGTVQLEGAISGIGIQLVFSEAVPAWGPYISLAGYTNPTATQITVSNLSYFIDAVGVTNVALNGTLTLQQ